MKTRLLKRFGASGCPVAQGGLFLLALSALMLTASAPLRAQAADGAVTVTFSGKSADAITASAPLAFGALESQSYDSADAAWATPGFMTSGSAAQGATFFSPNVNVGNAGRWRATFEATEAVTFRTLTLTTRTYASNGANQTVAHTGCFTLEADGLSADSGEVSLAANGVTTDVTLDLGRNVYLEAGDTFTLVCERGADDTGFYAGLTRLTLASAEQTAVTARYVRLSFAEVQYDTNTGAAAASSSGPRGIAFSELGLTYQGEPLDLSEATLDSAGNSGEHTAANLLDGSTDTKWYHEAATTWVSLDLKQATTFDAYAFTTADVAYRNPIAWTVEVSDDNATWRRVDQRNLRTKAAATALGTATAHAFAFNFPNTDEAAEGAARYVRFRLKLRDAAGGDDDAVSVALRAVDLLRDGQSVLPENTLVRDYSAVRAQTVARPSLMLTDDAEGTAEISNPKYWTEGANGVAAFTLDLGQAVAFDSYTLTTADVAYRDPVGWVVEVSDDNARWSVVDARNWASDGEAEIALGALQANTYPADLAVVAPVPRHARYVRFVFTRWQTPDHTVTPDAGENHYGVALTEVRLINGCTDVTAAATITATPEGRDGVAASVLKDGDLSNNKYWVSESGLSADNPLTITCDFGEAGADFDTYLLACADVQRRNPLAWRVELSDDGTDWEVWDERGYDDLTMVPQGYANIVVTPKAVRSGVLRAWRYLRWTSDAATSGDYPALGQFTPLLGGFPVLPGSGYSVSGSATQANCGWANIVDGEYCYRDANEKGWGSASPVTFTLDLGREIAFDGYRIQLADHGPRNPARWTLEGSNDQAEWTLLDRQDFGDGAGGSAYFGTNNTTTNTRSGPNGDNGALYTWRDFTLPADISLSDDPVNGSVGTLTGASVSFVLGACGQAGALDIAGPGLYGVGPYQVPGDGWNNLNLSGTGAYTLSDVHDCDGNPVEGMSFTVAANHGDLARVAVTEDPDYDASDAVMAPGYALLRAGAEAMAVLKTKNTNRGDIGSETFDEYTISGVPYRQFTAVIYIGRGVYTAGEDGHDPVVVKQTRWRGLSSGGANHDYYTKYTYEDGRLTIVPDTASGTTKVGLWGDPAIAWSNEIGSGVMVIPNLTPDANGNFTFNLSWKNNGKNNTSWRSAFRGVQLFEQETLWHEPLADETNAIGFAFGATASDEADLDPEALYGMDGYAFPGSGWNELTSYAQTFADGSVIDRFGEAIPGLTMTLERVSGSNGVDSNGNNPRVLPPFEHRTPYTQSPARVTLEGIPYANYSLILYLNKDLGWAKGSHIGPVRLTVDGATTSYTYRDGALVIGTDDWGDYTEAGVVGVEGVGVMVIPNLSAPSLTFETTGGDYNCQLQGFQIVETPLVIPTYGLLHGFHFDTIDPQDSRDVAPLDVGIGSAAIGYASDLTSSYRRLVAAGEGAFGDNALKMGRGVGGLGSGTNSDGLYLHNPAGLGCGSDTGFTLSFFWRLNADDEGDGRGILSFVVGGQQYRVGRHGGTFQCSLYPNGSWDDDDDGEQYAVYTTLTQGQWHHVALVYNPDVAADGTGKAGLDFYLDGEKLGSFYGAARVPEGQLTHLLIGRGFKDNTLPGSYTAVGTVNSTCVTNYKDSDLDEVGLFNFSATAEEVAWLAQNPVGLPPTRTPEDAWKALGPDLSAKVDQGNWSHFSFRPSGLLHLGDRVPTLTPGRVLLRAATVAWHFGGNNNANAVRLVVVDDSGNVAAVSEPSVPTPANAAEPTVFAFPEGTLLDYDAQYQGHFVPAGTVPAVGAAFNTAQHVTVRYETVPGEGDVTGFYVADNTAAEPVIAFVFETDWSGTVVGDGDAINIDVATDGMAAMERDGFYGVVPYKGSQWNVLSGASESAVSVSGVALKDSAGHEGITLSATGRSFGNWPSDAALSLAGCLTDPNTTGSGVTMTVEGIPYDTYDVYVYMAGGAWSQNGSVILNGDTSAYYYMAEGATEASVAASNTYWGDASSDAGTRAVLGENVLRIANVSGPTLTIQTVRGSGNGRACLHAVQIVERAKVAAINVKPYKDNDLADAGTYGLVPFAGAEWNRLKFSGAVNWSGTGTDTQGRPVSIALAGRGIDPTSRPSGADQLLRDALLDNIDGNVTEQPYVTVSGIPYETYDAYVYMTANAWSLNGSIVVNDDETRFYFMSGAEAAVASENTAWGNPQTDTPILGTNVIRIPGLSGDTLKLHPRRNDADSWRATIAAVQIVGRVDVEPDDTWVATLTGDTLRGTFIQDLLPLRLDLTRGDYALRRPQTPQPPFPYRSEEVRFTNTRDSVTLAGTLTLPDGPGPFPAVALVTGSGAQNRDEEIYGHKLFAVIADHLTRHGIAVLRYDDRGVGQSSGNFSAGTSEDFTRDALAAVDFLTTRTEIARNRIGLIGHSEGGMIVFMAAAQNPAIRGIPCRRCCPRRFPAVAAKRRHTPSTRRTRFGGPCLRRCTERDFPTAKRLSGRIPEVAAGLAYESAVVEYLRSQQDSLMRVLLAGNRKQLLPKPVQQNLQIILTTPLSTWMRFYTQFDPKPYIQATRCPVLALNGTLDRQVDAETNLGLIQEYTAQGGNRQVTVKTCEGLNHLFQHATTGAPNEYPYIAETFSPAALELITQWILQQPPLTEP